MRDVMVILDATIAAADRDRVTRLASPTQAISPRVFLARVDEASVPSLRAMPGVAHLLTGAEQPPRLAGLDPSESLFVDAWLSSYGQVKQRTGDGLNWDTPPRLPPDPDAKR